MSWSTVSTVLLFYASSLGASPALVGALWSILSLARLTAENPSGVLVERIGKRFTIILGLGIILISHIIFSLAITIYVLL